MPPRFKRVASAVLPGWELSLAFLPPQQAQRLNSKLRGKRYTPNVLSYRVGPKHGEVIICKEVARREAPRYGHSEPEHLLFLFIHALLHLEGMAHGSTMERREKSLLKTYGSTHRHRHRHRDLPGQGSRRRGGPR